MFNEIAGEKKVSISPAISSNIHRYFNKTFHEFKVLKFIKAETYNVNFRHKFIKFGFFSNFLHTVRFNFFIYFHIYIYIYIYEKLTRSKIIIIIIIMIRKLAVTKTLVEDYQLTMV